MNEDVASRLTTLEKFASPVIAPRIFDSLDKWLRSIMPLNITVPKMRIIDSKSDLMQHIESTRPTAGHSGVIPNNYDSALRPLIDDYINATINILRQRVNRDASTSRSAGVIPNARSTSAVRAMRNEFNALNMLNLYELGAAICHRTALTESMAFYGWYWILDAMEAGAWMVDFNADQELVVIMHPNILTDERGRLHGEHGSSFAWNDVRGYYWHNVKIPEYIITNPERITVDAIDAEQNAEIRRVMMGVYGTERFMQDVKVVEVDNNPKFGVLYRREGGDVREPFYAIRVTNATPEPDGTFRDFFIRIDPTAYNGDAGKHAQAASASTWRDEDTRRLIITNWREYVPRFES